MRDLFEHHFHISDAGVVQALLSEGMGLSLKKGSMLLESGGRQTHLIFLLEGVLRGFLVDVNGRDITDGFAFRRGDLIFAGKDISGPTSINVEALSDCRLFQLPLSALDEQLRQDPQLLLAYDQVLRKRLAGCQTEKRMLYLPAVQRYRWFLETYPGLIHSVSNKHIASFLGMTPVTLSRVRCQLRQEDPQSP